MKPFETSTIVQNQGEVHLAGVPFAPGTQVEVTISPKRRSTEEFAATWARVCGELRSRSTVSDEEIQQEIDDHRAGR